MEDSTALLLLLFILGSLYIEPHTWIDCVGGPSGRGSSVHITHFLSLFLCSFFFFLYVSHCLFIQTVVDIPYCCYFFVFLLFFLLFFFNILKESLALLCSLFPLGKRFNLVFLKCKLGFTEPGVKFRKKKSLIIPLKIGDYFLPPQFFDLMYEKQLDITRKN